MGQDLALFQSSVDSKPLEFIFLFIKEEFYYF